MQTALQDIEEGVNLYGQLVNNLCFAGDIDRLAEDLQHLQDITKAVHQSSKRYWLQINAAISKTKTIGKHHEQMNVTLDNEELQQVTEFVLPWWPGNRRCTAYCRHQTTNRISLSHDAEV